MSTIEITPDVERDEDGLPVDVARIADMLAADAGADPVFKTEWRLYVCWARTGRMGPLPKFSRDSEEDARERAGFASLRKGVRYAALFHGQSAWPAALYMEGKELKGKDYDEALFAA